MATRRCTRCKQLFPPEKFGTARWIKNGLNPNCKKCVRERMREYRTRHPETGKARHKEWLAENKEHLQEYQRKYSEENADDIWLMRRRYERSGRKLELQRLWKYGITPEAFADLLEKQGGKCAICERTSDNQKIFPYLDHCHETNKIRGILCKRCNLGLGFFGDKLAMFRKVVKYLEAAENG